MNEQDTKEGSEEKEERRTLLGILEGITDALGVLIEGPAASLGGVCAGKWDVVAKKVSVRKRTRRSEKKKCSKKKKKSRTKKNKEQEQEEGARKRGGGRRRKRKDGRFFSSKRRFSCSVLMAFCLSSNSVVPRGRGRVSAILLFLSSFTRQRKKRREQRQEHKTLLHGRLALLDLLLELDNVLAQLFQVASGACRNGCTQHVFSSQQGGREGKKKEEAVEEEHATNALQTRSRASCNPPGGP